jgi:AcrR family transcriptional regulator
MVDGPIFGNQSGAGGDEPLSMPEGEMPKDRNRSGEPEEKSELDRTARGDDVAESGRSVTQARRSATTRAALLAAAKTVFARDGFDAARIEDIAAAAGRTRGAFYANFASKNDVFLALRSAARLRSVRELRDRVEGLTGEPERYAAVLRFLMDELRDGQTLLLQIEFKLFALRHPKRLTELAGKHLDASTSVGREELQELFPEKVHTLQQDREVTLGVEALLEGFALNALFDPSVLTRAHLEALIPRLLEQILPRI